MVKKNDTPALILALLITLGLLGTGAWLFRPKSPVDPEGSALRLPPLPEAIRTSRPGQDAVARFSSGEQLLMTAPASPQKQAGITAYREADYGLAAEKFTEALSQNRNDPEARIYQQNAIAASQLNLTLGASLPLGTSENEALEMMRGISQAQAEINANGGINGKKLLIVLADDGNDSETAKQVAKSFGQEERVVGVVGSFGSSTSLATVDLYREAQLVHISPTSTSVELSDASPYFFRTVPSDYIAARSLADYALTNGQQQAVVYFNGESSYSRSLKEEFSVALSSRGGRIVSAVDLSQPNFEAGQSLQEATVQQADIVALFANKATRKLALQVIDANQRQLPIVGGDSIYSAATLETVGANSQDMVVAIPWHIDASPDPSFVTRSRDLWNATVNWRTALSYDAVQTLAEALGRSDKTRQGLHAALSEPGFQANGASGELYFLPAGDRNGSIQLVTVEQGEGPGGYVFVPVESQSVDSVD